MQPLPDLERLTEAEKLELLRQRRPDLRQGLEENARLTALVAKLEQVPPASPKKTPENSSVPPSSAPIPNAPNGRRRNRK